MKATFVRNLSNFNGEAKLFRVEPAAAYDGDKTTEHVAVSKVCGAWAHETYIFPANERGEVIEWTEMDGSARGEHSHEDVLRSAGYSISESKS